MKPSYDARPWLASYPAGMPAQLTPRFGDVLSAFRDAVAQCPDHTAITCFEREISFREWDETSDRIAAGLAHAGIGRQDRVSIISQNIPAFAEAAVAIWKIGAIPVPCNPMYRAQELGRIFADCAPAAVICEPSTASTVRDALHAAGLGDRPIFLAAPNPSPPMSLADGTFEPVAATSLDELGTGQAPPQPLPIDGRTIGLLLYTSGTTGIPKGAMLRHDSLAFNAEAMAILCGVHARSRILGIAPLFHITGFVSHLVMTIVMRCKLILYYRFDPGMVLDTIRRTRPTYTVGAITAFNALMNTPGACAEDFASFETVFSGGAAIPPALRDALADRLGIDIRPCYGMTETASPTHGCPQGLGLPADPVSNALPIGLPTPSTEAMIADEAGHPVPVGEAGEIWMRGPQVMEGYWNKPDETRDTLVDGWMRSGDIGFMDQAGWFFLVDRKKDMINASGYKVWPREVEDCLYGHPAVRDAAVVGVADAYRGENVAAYLSLKAGMGVEEDELREFCRARLAAYKCPRHFTILDDLPKTLTGKIQRNVIREMAQTPAKG